MDPLQAAALLAGCCTVAGCGCAVMDPAGVATMCHPTDHNRDEDGQGRDFSNRHVSINSENTTTSQRRRRATLMAHTVDSLFNLLGCDKANRPTEATPREGPTLIQSPRLLANERDQMSAIPELYRNSSINRNFTCEDLNQETYTTSRAWTIPNTASSLRSTTETNKDDLALTFITDRPSVLEGSQHFKPNDDTASSFNGEVSSESHAPLSPAILLDSTEPGCNRSILGSPSWTVTNDKWKESAGRQGQWQHAESFLEDLTLRMQTRQNTSPTSFSEVLPQRKSTFGVAATQGSEEPISAFYLRKAYAKALKEKGLAQRDISWRMTSAEAEVQAVGA